MFYHFIENLPRLVRVFSPTGRSGGAAVLTVYGEIPFVIRNPFEVITFIYSPQLVFFFWDSAKKRHQRRTHDKRKERRRRVLGSAAIQPTDRPVGLQFYRSRRTAGCSPTSQSQVLLPRLPEPPPTIHLVVGLLLRLLVQWTRPHLLLAPSACSARLPLEHLTGERKNEERSLAVQ